MQGIQLQTVVAAEAVPEIILSSVRAATGAKAMAMEITDAPMVAKDLQARGRAAIIGRIRDLIPLRPLPVGGCLSPYWKIWQREGASPWTVEVLRVGYRLPFVEEPPLSLKPMDQCSAIQQADTLPLLEEEIRSMVKKGAVEIVKSPSPGFYSRLFF